MQRLTMDRSVFLTVYYLIGEKSGVIYVLLNTDTTLSLWRNNVVEVYLTQ